MLGNTYLEAEMQAFEVSGLWWLPSLENEAVGGILSFTPESGAKLELIGFIGESDINGFSLLMDLNNNRLREYPVVLGITTNDEFVTLQNCKQINATVRSNGLPSQEFYVELVYKGAHFSSVDRIQFNTAYVQYTHLFEWANRRCFNWSGEFNQVTYNEPEDLVVEMEECVISITSSLHRSLDHENPSMHHKSWLKFQLQREIPFRGWMIRYISCMQDFLSLATARPNAVTSIKFGAIVTLDEDGESQTDEPVEIQIQIFYHPLYHAESFKKDRVLAEDMLFVLGDVSDFTETLRRWMRIYSELKTVCNLFFGSQYGPSKYIDARFLIAAQAAEMYDRMCFENRVLPRADHRARVRAVLAQVSDEYRGWVDDQLRYSNEPRLVQRLERLVDRAGDVLLPIIRDAQQFSVKVARTRNYYTHYNPDLQGNAAQGEELVWINQSLFFMLQRCFLYELGFSSEQCVGLFDRNRRYQNARRRARFSWDMNRSNVASNQENSQDLEGIVPPGDENPANDSGVASNQGSSQGLDDVVHPGEDSSTNDAESI